MRTKIYTIALLCALALAGCNEGKKVKPSVKWTPEQAEAWAASLPWLSGCNYNPASAINAIEMWSEDTYDHDQIDKELGWAEELGFNTMRTFLSSVVYKNDPEGMIKRMDDFLSVCDKHGIKPIFVIFDDCWNPESYYGKQPDPKPGIHNSGWTQDPAVSLRADTTALFPVLEGYVKAIVGAFRGDERLLMWDVYNEPGNGDHKNESIPLLKNVFRWAREAGTTQPLTAGVWRNDLKELNKLQLEESDVVTYHCYNGSVEEQQHTIDTLRTYAKGGPIINTEYMARRNDCTFQKIMPVLKANNVGAINWGFVAGKTNTIFAWGDPRPDVAEPELWFHDIFRQDHTPFSEEEVEVIKKCNGKE
ncbi:MAG: cellulase family glycosylhydrolase [Bacteroidales bacterium]|nr:cellulase family glycosylhydrolase [Bacteroidales bacterium]